MSEYAYAVDEDGIYTVLYGASRARVAFPGKDGEEEDSGVILVQETGYPYDGNIRFTFEEEETQALKSCGSFSLHLRIPSWVKKRNCPVPEPQDRGGRRKLQPEP